MVAALGVLNTYLRSHRFRGVLSANFPGMDGEATWKLLYRTFLTLELWSPLLDNLVDRPDVMRTSSWLNDVVRAIFGLMYSIVDGYCHSDLCTSLLHSKEAASICSRMLYGALAVDGSVLRPIVAVMVHPCWPRGSFRNEQSKLLLGTRIRQQLLADRTLSRFIHLLHPPTILHNAPELHAVAFALMHLADVARPQLMRLHLSRWLANCALYIMRKLRRVAHTSDTASVKLNSNTVGLLLLLCIKYLASVGRSPGSSGWVLEALQGGILRAVLDIGAYINVEKKTEEVYVGRVNLSNACGDFLQSLSPHLLSPPILVMVKKVLDGRVSHELSLPPMWGLWSEIVTQVYEVYFAYKISDYRILTKRMCSNDLVRSIFHSSLPDY
ncbi:hypothetical protein VNI00_016469 [Paramarasmius palmivorus]|uniref:Uncharacterized protein n=1 Tax=Paramarasmius palmivorus TaxID=297713 RepID=A0AAW0BDX2_9AGAR